ncbi:MAG: hypothetical protein EVJ46_00790 [Candidatus Acididesulfobacter guangdongensis]|uniref:PD-(D/E)XK endonuclease-like domain-containing protein n=1 Tax=Acididesulfobacter guangdongensis TaxID=2597225 RepID=A0A519BHQ8_ACIG2|nr:MAG: hypothetical protein EVJ46_00790 [Candidatus Acididesulfobacter guangdongensis]
MKIYALTYKDSIIEHIAEKLIGETDGINDVNYGSNAGCNAAFNNFNNNINGNTGSKNNGNDNDKSGCSTDSGRAHNNYAENKYIKNNIKNSKTTGRDFSKYAIVFAGKRPALYLKNILSDKIGAPCEPPHIFSINEFIKFIAEKSCGVRKDISIIDAVWFLYNITKDIFKAESYALNQKNTAAPAVAADTGGGSKNIEKNNDHININIGFRNIKKFDDFFPWGLQLFNVINELDAEAVENSELKSLKSYLPDMPESIRRFYNSLSVIRENFHNRLYENNLSSPGLDYIDALKYIKSGANILSKNISEDISKNISDFGNEFKKIYFAGFISLNKTEAYIFKTLAESGDAEFYTQFESLKKEEYSKDYIVSKLLNALGNPEIECIFSKNMQKNPQYGNDSNDSNGMNSFSETVLNFHEGFDVHSELESKRNINILDKSNFVPETSAIILPDSNTLMPLLYHVINYMDCDYNITMGYSLKRTPLYSLLDLVSKVQGTKLPEKNGNSIKNGSTEDAEDKYSNKKNNHEYKYKYRYFAKDYINLLKHPYIKMLCGEGAVSAADAAEEYIISNNYSYIALNDIENSVLSFDAPHSNENSNENKDADVNILTDAIKKIHEQFFINFEADETTPENFSNKISEIINKIIISESDSSSAAADYKPAPEFTEKIIEILNILGNSYCGNETMTQKSIFRLFKYYIDNEFAAFKGIPLKGLQIMGLLETRALQFDKVIIFDANEDILPPVKKYDPMLPYTLRKKLGVLCYADYEALYRYYFRRLIFGAREADIIYIKNDNKIRSRFIEEIIWDEEKKAKKLDIKNINILSFKTDILQKSSNDFEIKKNKPILEIIDKIFTKLSITAIDTYINCPVQFYYKYIAGLSEADTIKAGYAGADRVGIFEHRVLKKFYEDFLTTKDFNKNCANSANINMYANTNTDINKNRNTCTNTTDSYTDAKTETGMKIHIKTCAAADENFLDNYIKEKINGIIDGCENEADDFLVKETSKNLLFNFIKHDLSNNCLNKKGWEILGLERRIEAEFNIGKYEADSDKINCEKTVKLFGIIDRIDKFKNNCTGDNNNENNDNNDNNYNHERDYNSLDSGESFIIIDYKTGKHAAKPDIDKLNDYCGGKPLTDRSKIKEFIKSFQLPVYMYLFKQAVLNADNKKAPVKDCRNAGAGDYAKINACLGMVSQDIRTGKDKYRQYMFNANKENNDGADIMENIIMPSLANIIKEISDEEKPFVPDYSDDIVCGYCSYSLLCGKIFN